MFAFALVRVQTAMPIERTSEEKNDFANKKRLKNSENLAILSMDGERVKMSETEKTCVYCGKSFMKLSQNQKFCSKECRFLFYGKSKKQTVCLECGIVFEYEPKIIGLTVRKVVPVCCSDKCEKKFTARARAIENEAKRMHSTDKSHLKKVCPICSLQARDRSKIYCPKCRAENHELIRLVLQKVD